MLCIDNDGSLHDYPERDFLNFGSAALACAQRPEPRLYFPREMKVIGLRGPMRLWVWEQDGTGDHLVGLAAMRIGECEACAFLTLEMCAAAHGASWPFHNCGRDNPAPAPGRCAQRDDGAHVMRRRFAGEMLVTDCAACGALSPDSD